MDEAKLAEVCRRYHVLELSVFGSAARGEMRPESDIDLLVEFLPGAKVDLFDYSGLMLDLSKLIGRKVDLVSKKGLKPLIRSPSSKRLGPCMRHESLYLHDIVEAADDIARFISGIEAETFQRNHANSIVACDFCTSFTASFRVLCVFVAMEIGSRRILHTNVTAHPTAEWTIQQFREFLVFDHPYRFLIRDRDGIFSAHFANGSWGRSAGSVSIS